MSRAKKKQAPKPIARATAHTIRRLRSSTKCSIKGAREASISASSGELIWNRQARER
jgi:hypothetical protein